MPASLSAGIQRTSSLDLAGAASPTAALDPAAPRSLARASLADGTLWFASAAPVFAGGLSPTLGTAFFAVTPDVASRGRRRLLTPAARHHGRHPGASCPVSSPIRWQKRLAQV